MRTPREVVEAYNYELWNRQRLELADELLAETVVRHEIGGVKTLTRAEAAARVPNTWSGVEHLEFVLIQIAAEAELVTIVYECRVVSRGEKSVMSSMEMFRVVDGQICEVWNVGYAPGSWA